MKDAVILLLCAIALADAFELNADQRLRSCNCDPSEAQQICQANFGNDNILIAHEYCDKFYLCTNGKPVAQNCPANLLYNPFLERCEWPDNVDCGDRPISDGNEEDDDDCDDNDIPDEEDNVSGDDNGNDRPCNCNPAEAPSLCAAEGSTGIFIAHENCNQFYTCDQGRPVTLNCPPTLLYNPHSEVCDWPKNVDCGDRVIPEPDNDDSAGDENDNDGGDNDGTCNCNPEEAPAICAVAGSDGVLVAHENCDKYYICNHGRPVVATCPNGLLFNPYTKECDWARNVDCGDRIVPEGNGCSSCNEGGDVDEPPPCDDADNENDDIGALPPVGDGPDNDSDDIEQLPPAGDISDEDSNEIDLPVGDDPGSDSVEVDVTPPSNNNPDDSGNNNNGTCNCIPEEAPSVCAADGSDGVLIAHENCNQFYKCDHGKPVVLSCPGNLLYNPYTEKCDWPENVDCGDRVIPDRDDDEDSGNDNNNNENDGDDNQSDNNGGNDSGTCNCNPEEAPSVCAADGSDGVLIAHENCNQFYKCDHGKPVVLSCPGNLLYNPYTEKCDWPENVDCGDRVIPDRDDDEDSGNDNNNNENDGDDNQSDNNGGNDSGTCNCNPEEAPSVCAADGSDGVLIAHENCNQFYKCDHGKPVVLSCPGNLLYNPYTEQCDWPENVDCGDRVIPNPDDVNEDGGNDNDSDDIDNLPPPSDDPGSDSVEVDDTPPSNNDPEDSENDNNGTCNCNPEEAPLICQADNSDGVLIAHENCNQFYKCDHGKPVAFICPGSLLYNPVTEKCDWPENVDCGDRVIPDPDDDEDTGNDNNNNENDGDDNQSDNNGGNDSGTCNCNPEEAPSVCAADGSDGVLIAHENCNQFYKCDHGKPVVLSCPGNLLYNPYTEQCDWADNVDCGDRVIPNPDDVNEDGGNDNDSDDIDNLPPPADDPGSDSVEVDDTPPSNNDPEDSGNDNNGTCNCNPEEAPLICQVDNSDGVLIAHENCNQFYKCDHGKPVAFICPGSLLYNPITEKCDWPENVDCGDRVIPDPDDDEDSGNDNDNNENDGDDNQSDNNGGNDSGTCNCNPEEAPSICAADDSDGVLIANENCNQFYKCDHGKPVVLKCPGDLLYNQYTQQCDWPENVDCGDRVNPDPEDDSDVTLPPIGEDSGNDNNGSDGNDLPPIGDGPGNDNDGNDDSSEEDLPQGDNPGNDDTNPDDSDCDDTDDGNEGTCNCQPDEAPSICAVNGSDGVLIAHEYCTHFYKCDNGKPVPFKCGSNLLYNPINQVCDWPDNVECGDRGIPDHTEEDNVSDSAEVDDDVYENENVTCNCNPEEAPEICAVIGSDGIQIAHENCNQFYQCSFGRPVAVSCPSNLLYNPYIEVCDWPENVKCGDRVIPDAEDNDKEDSEVDDDNNDSVNIDVNDDPSQAPAICADSGSNGVLVAHENCNQFYICSAGSPVTLSCSGQLLFNPQTNNCDWPNNVDCGDRIVSGNDNDCACNPRNAPTLCARPESNGKLVAHENCNQFYMCVNGVPVARDCPANLHYNIDKELCDWPQNVNCEMRMVYTSLNKHLESRQALRK